MDRFPVELLRDIATYACTDGGRTGCSLALVSRHVHDATSCARYQSVSLIGRSNIIAFSELATNMHGNNISYLFITTSRVVAPSEESGAHKSAGGPGGGGTARGQTGRDEEKDDDDDDDDADDDDDDDENDAEEENINTDIDEEEEIPGDHILKIIQIAASSLVTLFLHTPGSTNYAFPFPTLHFPQLRDLSVSSFPSYRDYETQEAPSFPVLRRLHVSSYTGGGRWRQHNFWTTLGDCVPSLEALRLTGFTGDTSIDKFLRVLLSIPLPGPRMIGNQTLAPVAGEGGHYPPGSDQELQSIEVAEKLPRLKTVYVQPGVYVQRGWCGTGRFVNSAMNIGLFSVAQQTAKGEGNGRIYHLGVSKGGYTGYEARSGWMDVVHGGTGPWTAPKE